jgi:hypothetical protein
MTARRGAAASVARAVAHRKRRGCVCVCLGGTGSSADAAPLGGVCAQFALCNDAQDDIVVDEHLLRALVFEVVDGGHGWARLHCAGSPAGDGGTPTAIGGTIRGRGQI